MHFSGKLYAHKICHKQTSNKGQSWDKYQTFFDISKRSKAVF